MRRLDKVWEPLTLILLGHDEERKKCDATENGGQHHRFCQPHKAILSLSDWPGPCDCGFLRTSLGVS